MAIEIKHKFTSQKADGADASLIRPSNWNDTHQINLAGQRLLGKPTANQGAAVEISLGNGLAFSGSSLVVDTEYAGGTVGEVAFFARNSAPPGWLKANGAAVSRTTYAALFAAIGTTFGAGNGSSTFAVPDMRGEFPRGWDDGRGADSGRGFGSTQGDQNASHTHTGTAASAGAHNHSASSNSTGAHTHTSPMINASSNSGSRARTASSSGSSSSLPTNSAGAHSHSITVNSNGAHTHSVTTNSSGGNEARPRNRALLACIKF